MFREIYVTCGRLVDSLWILKGFASKCLLGTKIAHVHNIW